MRKRPHIIAESTLPYLRGVLEQLGKVTYLRSHDFAPDTIADADWLIVRSITRCTEELLHHSRVQLITTATIGYDHIDTDYCARAGIAWANAPGCNAGGVGLYAGAVLAHMASAHGWELGSKTIGIIGAGHTGMEAARYARALGMRVLLCDPPRAEREGAAGFVPLQQILEEADVVELHVPYTRTGRYATHHMVDRAMVAALKRRPMVANYCRGSVTDTSALLWGVEQGLISHLCIDCWEGEPSISRELLEVATIGTPHIAGFSADGKSNGARMCIEAGVTHFGLDAPDLSLVTPPAPEQPIIDLSRWSEPLNRVEQALLTVFDPKWVDEQLRIQVDRFEEMRKGYHFPREPHAYTVVGATPHEAEQLTQMGFMINI